MAATQRLGSPTVERRRPCALVRALLALLACVLALPEGIAAEPQVLVLNNGTDAPLTNPEGTGFLDVVATEAFRRVGLELRLVKLPAERALLLANSGSGDGDLLRPNGLEKPYPNLVRVPEKLFDLEFAAFSKDASIPGRIDAIRGRAVGIIRGWKTYELALAGAERAITVDNVDQLFRLLQLDRIEVAIYARRAGLAHLKNHGIKDVRVLEPSLEELEMFIYLHRRHTEQVPKLAAALRALKREGFYQRAYRERFLPYAEEITR